MIDWKGRSIIAGRSRGGVAAVANYADGLIRVDDVPWPPPAIVQKLYESRHVAAFDAEHRATVTEVLGFYSDLQSLSSEDAMTWSYFGPLMYQPMPARAAFVNRLVKRIGLPWTDNEACSIDLWRRVPHPDKPLPGGPELDFLLDGDTCVIFGEAKWHSPEARDQGVNRDKTQLQLRREWFERYGRTVYGDRGFAVLGVSYREGAFGELPADAPPVHTRALTWWDLVELDGHPSQEELYPYIEWKTARHKFE